MSLSRLIWKTLNNERTAIFVYFLNTVVLILIFTLMMDSVHIIYPICVSSVIMILYLVYKTVQLNLFLKNLETAKTQADEFNADTYTEEAVYSTIEEMHMYYGSRISSLHEQLDGRNNLFSQFFHNMKSSISVIGLACENRSEDTLSDISMENEKLKKNLEQALNLLRLDEFSNDYVSEKVDLFVLVKNVINEKKRDIIYSKTYPKYIGSETFVYTDKKWCAFLIEQIVTNAIKYSEPDKSIYFEIQKKDGHAHLCIRDEGVGILPEDLPRIFELFYTGTNGRQNKESTGIGLSMAKHICKKLGHEISVESQVGCGTAVTITFLTKM